MAEQEKYERAKKRVEDIRGFYIHLAIYLVVNGFIIAQNLIISPDALWFYWPLLGWGVGILIHGLSVFVFEGALGKGWEEKKIKEMMDEEAPKKEE